VRHYHRSDVISGQSDEATLGRATEPTAAEDGRKIVEI
jgi:hypothetical protein